MLLLRYENSKRQGPYTAPFCKISDELRDFHSQSKYERKFPILHEDFKQHIWEHRFPRGFGDYVCACTSIEALREWFEGWHDRLIENGFKPLIIAVKDSKLMIGESNKQAVFKRFDGVITGQVAKELLC
jgi:hypothetical protein